MILLSILSMIENCTQSLCVIFFGKRIRRKGLDKDNPYLLKSVEHSNGERERKIKRKILMRKTIPWDI